jgi:hypothetical protein
MIYKGTWVASEGGRRREREEAKGQLRCPFPFLSRPSRNIRSANYICHLATVHDVIRSRAAVLNLALLLSYSGIEHG